MKFASSHNVLGAYLIYILLYCIVTIQLQKVVATDTCSVDNICPDTLNKYSKGKINYNLNVNETSLLVLIVLIT